MREEDQASAPDDLLERLTHELAATKMPRLLSIPAFRVESRKDESSVESLQILLRDGNSSILVIGLCTFAVWGSDGAKRYLGRTFLEIACSIKDEERAQLRLFITWYVYVGASSR